MRLAGNFSAAGWTAFFACAAFGACTYDFDGLVAHTGTDGSTGIGGAAGQGGSSGAAGSDDGGGAAGTQGDGAGGSSGTGTGGASGGGGSGGTDAGRADAGKGGNAGADAGKGGNAGTDAGKDGNADAPSDRGPDAIADVRSDGAFDCTAVSGTVYQGHCYYASPTMTNWDTAKTTACAAPSHLAVITTVGEQGVVAAILPGMDRWIGLRKELPPNMESSFRWVTGEAFSYKIWDSYDTGPPEPNYTGDCVRMRPTNSWGDTACTEMYAAVCEYE
jgi:hypothetical protein